MQYQWLSAERAPLRICFTDTPSPMKPHTQDELELMYFFNTSGCQYKCNGCEMILSEGQLAAVNPGEFHSCNDWGTDCRAVCLIIDLQKLAPPSLRILRFDNVICDPQITDIMKRLYRFLKNHPNSAMLDCLVFGCIYELLAILVKYARKTDANRSMRKNELDFIKNYVLENLSANLRVGELAAKVHLSEDRFYHVFKEAFGISPTEYILDVRIAHACNLLARSDLNVTAIAQECGFCTASYFSKQFRQVMRLSPLQYRRELQKTATLSGLFVPHL